LPLRGATISFRQFADSRGRHMRARATVRLGLIGLLGCACSAPRNAPPAGEQGVASDSTTLARLEAEARALARAEGCEAAGDCRVAPVGARPCGGPRDYLVYCARRTDSAALFRKLAELQRAEQAYNERQGLMGTCEFRTPPGVALAGGACRAAP